MPNSSAYQPAAVRDGLPMPERRLAMVVIVLGIFLMNFSLIPCVSEYRYMTSEK